MSRLYIALVGLPARGKSFLAERLREGLEADGLRVKVFNNGALRRLYLGADSAQPEFYNPENEEGRMQREQLALLGMRQAGEFLRAGGQVAILDATNGSRRRRQALERHLDDAPLLFIECVNSDAELLEAGIRRKAELPEFSGLGPEEAVWSFKRRIAYYERIFSPLREEEHFVRVETLSNRILEEHSCSSLPFYIQIRDILISDRVLNLYLLRHGQSEFNVRNRIGGDSGLTALGQRQAEALGEYFKTFNIPYIFTSSRRRAWETAAPIIRGHPDSAHIIIPEFDEINAGICEGMSYEEIRASLPGEYAARQTDKYAYVYPGGEGYITLKERVTRGFRKALFFSGAAPGIMVIGHQAINRVLLSHFFFRRDEAVPYIYVPQDEYFHIVSTHRKTLLELVRFTGHAD
jgi:broad specificity phosphatase PhoE/predicted kinase